MAEDRSHRASDEATAAAKQRKKRKWDQPAEHLVSAAAAVAGLPLNIGALTGVPLPGAVAYSAAPLPNIVPGPYALPPQLAPSVLQNAANAVHKLSQAKIPDELIAREIVINDAEPSIRYKLTKRQTQEEIQKCTGTVIITRGKYHPPNGQSDGDKPLYLHISAGSQLEDTAERIKAVDCAASMVEEMLKQGQSSQIVPTPFPSIQNNGQAVHPFSASIFLGFDADPFLNIAARIRGSNDQYINHIMNETGVTVVLRGKGSGNVGICHAEASEQPLHLYLSSLHVKNLEPAKVLAENLLDTIAAECGASRISSKVYSAVPPPQQLLAGVQTSATVLDVHSALGPSVPSTSGLTGASQCFVSSEVTTSLGAPSVTLQSGAPAYCEVPPAPVNGGTFYSGYGGIYPQATPLQQVAFTLRHASSSTAPVVPTTSVLTSIAAKVNPSPDVETDKRPQKRKFQELPVSKGPTTESQVFSLTFSEAHRLVIDMSVDFSQGLSQAGVCNGNGNSPQGSKFLKTGLDDLGEMSSLSMPLTKKIVLSGSTEMLPPASRGMPPHPTVSDRMLPPHLKDVPPPRLKNMPPPPAKFPSNEMLSRIESRSLALQESMAPPRSLDIKSALPPKFLSAQLPSEETKKEKSSSTPVSDTLLKLMDYGDDDDDIDETDCMLQGNSTPRSRQKPFWAV